uniref:Ubiquitin carboxyl-terminal hydrolase n=1 Tax=Myripristis murdjan TaxID=586833 RepID=A0A667XEJ5_9TELE
KLLVSTTWQLFGLYEREYANLREVLYHLVEGRFIACILNLFDMLRFLCRVLEASIAENKASLKRTHTEVWSDSPNPHDRKRMDNCPVGLKNVGNTCWFSAVIQSLFNLLEFQRLVLHYSPPNCVHLFNQEHRNLPFMQELRNLFSLMVGSKRKYVDPSRAVEILKDAFKSSESQQQDVSEFTHKLLDWLEDAFQMKAEEDREGEKPKNPMVELFYGRFLAVGVLEGKKFENTEMFGQYPLQVNGFKDLHECLEAAMIEGEIESLHSAENSARSGQEHWFTELPPVLTFELSRFEFNQALGRPEKIHNKLEFPSMLYMDRYMDRNRDITRIKREEIRRLKEHLTLLQQRLERYLSYGSGPKRFPLADVLQYAMEFASSKPVCTSPVEDIDTSAPPGGTTGPPLPPPSTAEQGSLVPPDGSATAAGPATAPTAAQQQRVPIHKPFTQSRLPPDLPMHPAPRHITEEELRVLEGCLHRWRSEVENDTRDLQGSISRIHRTIEMMYSDKSMMQVPYRLHAVLVHEGQANAGHYWAYIYDPHQRRWMKYNDISVTKSSWEELVRDSFGGYRNASAYCLMYINDKKPFLIEGKRDGLDKLPPDLKQYVKEDNELFDKEIEEWDALQARKAQQEKLALATAAASTLAASSASTSSSSPQPMSIESSPPDNTGQAHSHSGAPSRDAIKVEYTLWHTIQLTLSSLNFRETTIFMMIGLELFQKRNYVEALMYLIYSYQYNRELLAKGLYRGHDEELLGYYRRECLLKLNEQAAAMFESGEEPEVTTGLGIMNELVVPCIPLLLVHDAEKDLLAVEDMRNRWCSYLGQEMESNLQEKLTDFLPKLLDCSTEIKSFHDPPKLPTYSTLDLFRSLSTVTVK